MRVLVLGSGAREHAIAWRLLQDENLETVYLHPGNAGTLKAGIKSLPGLLSLTPESLVQAVKEFDISLVVIGPEMYLVQGYADLLRAEGVLVVGPSRSEAQLESSKVFSKKFMKEAGVPTADYGIADSPDSLRKATQGKLPLALKYDGLAAGKGVVLARTAKDVELFIDRVWGQNEFGTGAHQVVFETLLEGVEISYLGLCDGKNFLTLPTSTDHKRALDGDQGPNTGGMGAVSPSPYLTADLEKRIQEEVVFPILSQMVQKSWLYRGVLYIGLMINQKGQPFVLEFNTRFGDPETQAILPRIQGSFLDLLLATARGNLAQFSKISVRPEYCVYIVGAAPGYPQSPKTGDAIEGLGQVPDECFVFFAGVKDDNGRLATSGGRVLGVGSLDQTRVSARNKAYQGISQIRWPGIQYRKDIGS